ncbi:MAG: addiction module protein [Methylacidiphilales bacterium]|nr:addiction module protein [Candidatus Methylacidiphilales bacterium]
MKTRIFGDFSEMNPTISDYAVQLTALTKEALSLPADARAQLIDRLVESLGLAEDVSFRQLWAAEALRRRDEVRAGRVQTIPGNEALKLAREAASE